MKIPMIFNKPTTDARLKEYLRRNLLHCSSIGCHANAQAALKRVQKLKRPQKWLVELLAGIVERAGKVRVEMRAHADELIPR